MTRPAASGRARELLIDWANSQDHWIRAIVLECIQTYEPLAEGSIQAAYQQLLQATGLAPGTLKTVPPLETDAVESPAEQSLVLTALERVTGVNTLAGEQCIEFHPRITVLFGENGVGKSGYVRVLKAAAGVRTAEAVLGDVRAGETSTPRATIRYVVDDGEPQEVTWEDERGLAPLARIDVFDARGILLHVDGDLTYVYTPGDLALFRIVHVAIDAVRQLLVKARKERETSGNPFVAMFPRDAQVFPEIESLSASSDLPRLSDLAALADDELDRLEVARKSLAGLQSGGTAAKLQLARQEIATLRRVNEALEAVAGFDRDAHSRAVADLESARARYVEISAQSFVEDDVPGVLLPAWRAFISAAEAYVQESHDEDYPTAGAACVYCRQPLSSTALELVRRYRAFSRDAQKKAITDAEGHLTALRDAIREVPLDPLATELSGAQCHWNATDAIPDVVLAARDFVAAAQTLRDAVVSSSDLPDRVVLDDAVDALRAELPGVLADAVAEERRLADDLADRSDPVRQLENEIRDLEARLKLSEQLAGVRTFVLDARWAERAVEILKRLRPVTKSLTDTAKIASEELLNQDFEARFRQECTALRAPPVRLQFPGRKGEPIRRKSVAPKRLLSTILSEGEQKAVALADFLAESTLRRGPSPVVLDDPVTSLDYRRMEHVVRRLVELCNTRQVIVFTHNIWFTMELLSAIEKAGTGCSYYSVSAEDGQCGVVAAGSSPRLDTWGNKRARINKLIEKAKGQTDQELREMVVEKGYAELRGACEIVVEQDALQRVIQSYQPNVMVGCLSRINTDALPSVIETITRIHDRCCRIIGSHKQPLETLNVRPTLDELKDDWAALQRARTVARQR